jgi:hypothetical protein
MWLSQLSTRLKFLSGAVFVASMSIASISSGSMGSSGAVTLESIRGSAVANASAPQKMTVELAVGTGFHLCPESKTLPPLEDAYLCPGAQPGLRNIQLELESQKTAKPEWLLYSGRYELNDEFDGTKSKAEFLISYAKVDGKTYVFIDGRVTSERPGVAVAPVYFRLSAEGGFGALSSSLLYGAAVNYELEPGHRSNYSPVIAIAKKQ